MGRGGGLGVTRPGDATNGPLARVRVPGDKSVSHRALLLAALADGESRLRGLLPGADCRSTAAALRALGVDLPDLPVDGREIRVRGVGLRGLRPPSAPLDCGNSGTTARLLLGVLAGARVPAVLTGDASLRSRPMRRVTGPLETMGSRFADEAQGDRLPVRVLDEGEFRGGRWVLPVASAQVKSALLLAGLLAGRPIEVEEPGPSRDHTERMLRAMGVAVEREFPEPGSTGGRRIVRIPGGIERLEPLDLDVPGDPSSAAFLVALAALGGAGTGLRIEGVGINPTRIGFLPVMERMGVRVRVEAAPEGPDPEAGEPVADLEVGPSALVATSVEGGEIPTLIDELPLVAAMAVRARGTTRIRDAAELRVKESDRIRVTVRNLVAIGADATELPDGLDVVGTTKPLAGRVATHHDHRIAMAFGVLGALPGSTIEVADPAVVEVSFPGFWEQLAAVSGTRVDRPPPLPVVTLDGPAGSGKSTTARAVAERLGFLHLDSGALYRGVTLALLDSGRPEATWDEVTPDELEAFGVALEQTPEGFRVRIGDEAPGDRLRSPGVTARVSRVAAIPAVRRWLLSAQRATARGGGVVADGRDMGTVVFPDAEVKVFLVADLGERARRRLAEGSGAGEAASDAGELGAEAERLARRDREDSSRAVAPLRAAPDAVHLDTTHLTFEEQVDRVVDLVRGRMDPRRRT
jgi:3-phosphoshikimate 1-carboxyvinyltransferase